MAYVAESTVARSTVGASPSLHVARPAALATSIVLCVGVLLTALSLPALLGRVFVADDLGQFHLPARAFYAEALAAGERFDWWPQLFGGFYLTGEGQAGAYHPIHLALYRLLPLSVAFDLEILLSYPLMLVGCYWWLRRLLPRRDAALFGSLLFTFSGFNLLHLIHVNAVAIIAHIPWLLWAIDVAIRDPRQGKAAAAWGLIPILTASQLLLGYPQYVWFSLLIELGYAAWLLRRTPAPRAIFPYAATTDALLRVNRFRIWLKLFAALAVGFLLGGIQLLPTLDALQNSVRNSATSDFADFGSLHPWNLVQLVGPYLFRDRVVGSNVHELGLYAGCVPLVLSAWLWGCRRELRTLRPLARSASWLGLFGLIMALGSYGYLYHVQTWLPVVGKFRFPCRAILLVHLSTAILAGIALCMLAAREPHRPQAAWRSFGMLWTVVAASVVAAVAAPLLAPEYIGSWQCVLVGPTLIIIAAALVYFADQHQRWALVGLVLLAAVDLGYYGLSYSVVGKTATLNEFVARRPGPTAGEPTRLLADMPAGDLHAAKTGNAILLSGFSRIDGYAGLEPARQLDYSQLAVLQSGSVAWVSRSPESERIASLEPASATLLRVPDPLPKVRLVTAVKSSTDPARDLATIDPTRVALVDPTFSAHCNLPAGTPGTLRVVAAAPGRFEIITQCSTPQLLVVNESWHTGWTAIIHNPPTANDAGAAAVGRVNGDFFGCVVPAGETRVAFRFEPRSLRNGAWVCFCGLGLWMTGLIWNLRRGRARKEETLR